MNSETVTNAPLKWQLLSNSPSKILASWCWPHDIDSESKHNTQISSDTHAHINTHSSMHVCMCTFHHKWISPWPRWQLRSQFDVNSCWLSSAWSAYSTSSVILSMVLWQGQLPWGKALATTSCNKAPQGIHQAKRPPKSTEPFAKTDKMLYN